MKKSIQALLVIGFLFGFLGCKEESSDSQADALQADTGLSKNRDGGKECTGGQDQNISDLDGNCGGPPREVDLNPSSLTHMHYPRVHPTATSLKDGRVLVVGGTFQADPIPAEIYDPLTNSWKEIGLPIVPNRMSGVAILLDDGRVLIAGGELSCSYGRVYSSGNWYDCNPGYPKDVREVEIFDPRENQFHVVSVSSHGREGASVTKLPNGTVLILGGMEFDFVQRTISYFRDGDIYDPATETFHRNYMQMQMPRAFHSASLTSHGDLLIVGGSGPGGHILGRNEVYVGHWAQGTYEINPLRKPRVHHHAFICENDDLVVLGGFIEVDGHYSEFDQTTDLFLSGGSFQFHFGDLPRNLYSSEVIQLSSSRIAIVSGGREILSDASVSVESKEIWVSDSSKKTFQVAGELEIARSFPKAVELRDGSILVVGGVSHWGQGTDNFKVEDSVERIKLKLDLSH